MIENKEWGKSIYDLTEKIYPICRSLTGDGVRKTLDIIDDYIRPSGYTIVRTEIPTGTKVFDWEIPKEWKINEGYIEDEENNRIIDFADRNIHILGYSLPVDKWVSLDELKKYIYTESSQPDVIPYVTSYYEERFGFCMSQSQLDSLKPEKYHMYIDSQLFNGSLTYGELLIPGHLEKEILFSTYICHPSMANDNCSGPALTAALINYVSGLRERRYSYRFIFIPETIGAIAYISKNLHHLREHIEAGFILSCVGDNHDYSIVHTIEGNSLSDRVLMNVLRSKDHYTEYSFLKRASDERQYNAPGVDLSIVSFCRSKYGEFPQYHTSEDDLSYVSIDGFAGSFDVMSNCIMALEKNYLYRAAVLCEAQLGKRGLYPTVSQKGTYNEAQVLCDILAYADGKRDLIEISDCIHVPICKILPKIKLLVENGILGYAR